jgi:hypothetical protein
MSEAIAGCWVLAAGDEGSYRKVVQAMPRPSSGS